MLGSSISGGTLRAYVLRSGRFGLNNDKKLRWLPPRVQVCVFECTRTLGVHCTVTPCLLRLCQMMFQIEGDKRQGMVCVEATRDMSNLRQLTVSLLTVDVFRSSGQADLVVVSGDKDRLQVCCDLVTPTSSVACHN